MWSLIITIVALIDLGEPIQPTKVDDVTMLFSDIVGFTAICATCTPMMVVNMLNSLYTQFDHYCGMLDVYKVLSQFWRIFYPEEHEILEAKLEKKNEHSNMSCELWRTPATQF